MSRKGGLGKGLDALLPGHDQAAMAGSATFVPIEAIAPNPHQPRYAIKEDDLAELAASIREHGVLQPLIVTHDLQNNRYLLIAGERRLRAAGLAGLNMVPVVIRQTTDQEMLEIALIENLQRSDLSPLETAGAYRQLEEVFGLTHDEIAIRVGKSRPAVTNTLRLLKLSEKVLSALQGSQISEGHARALLMLPAHAAQTAALQTILNRDLSVRQTEQLVKLLAGEKKTGKKSKEIPPEIRSIEDRLMDALQTRVNLTHGKKGGTITIHYYSDEELEALLQRFTE